MVDQIFDLFQAQIVFTETTLYGRVETPHTLDQTNEKTTWTTFADR